MKNFMNDVGAAYLRESFYADQALRVVNFYCDIPRKGKRWFRRRSQC